MDRLENFIYEIRGQKVMLDADLANVYGVTTARLNQQVKRNQERFPTDFVFQLTGAEYQNLMLQIATSKTSPSALLEPLKREIEFHVKEASGRYAARRRS